MKTAEPAAQVNERDGEGKRGFFHRLLSLFSGTDDREYKKRRLLKEIERKLNASRFEFYRRRDRKVLPAMGRFFYDIYGAVSPAQLVLDKADASAVLKDTVIMSVLSDEESELLDRLSEETVKRREADTDPQTLMTELREELREVIAAFDLRRCSSINSLHHLLHIFLDFMKFDYYFLLRKFDPRLPERDFRYHPRFEAVSGLYVVDDLKDFLEVVILLRRDADWTKLFEVFTKYRDTPLINPEGWKKVLRTVFDVRDSMILELIVRHIEQDPLFETAVDFTTGQIAEAYISTLKLRVEATIRRISIARRKRTVGDYLVKVFGTSAVSCLRFYTEKENARFTVILPSGYGHIDVLNYTAAFLTEFEGEATKNFIDVFLIRGKWYSQEQSLPLSSSYHGLLSLASRVTQFDESLALDGELGRVLDREIAKAERDKAHIRGLAALLEKVDLRALALVRESAKELIVLGGILKALFEDSKKPKPEMLHNWIELKSVNNENIRNDLVGVYRKIYHFLRLIETLLKKG